jgi:hypothetical protein
MAVRRRKQETQLAFEAISIEGGLLSPDWLARVAQLQAANQTDADYAVPKGLNLRDEIGRYWRMAQAHWKDFVAGQAAGADARLLAERFVVALLRDSFGFASLAAIPAIQIADRSFPIGFSAQGQRVPVIVAPAGRGLEAPLPEFGDGGRRRTAFGLAQEYLNEVDEALWGLVSDGNTLRILRDNASLTRPAWIEADLARIFTEERYADFAALWLLVHDSRFGKSGQPATDCALETWRAAGREEGTRAREDLRRGVEDALLALGQGFVAHPENAALRAALADGSLATKDYFNQLLRLVYRLIFLLTVEERGLLEEASGEWQVASGEKQVAPAASHSPFAIYLQGYGMRRLRERAVKRSAHDRFPDLWEAQKIVFRGLAAGEPRLALPALAGIFAKTQCPALDSARLENHAFLLAVFRLSWLREESGLARVNWRDMGPEELGSVYESLLELVPQISGGRTFAFAAGGETKGNARKTTGSYYTPDSLVQVLLDSALEPVVEQVVNGQLRVASGVFSNEQERRDAHEVLSRSRDLGTWDADRGVGLPAHAGLSEGGNVRSDIADPASRSVDPSEHRRGLGAPGRQGVLPLSTDRERQSPRAGNAPGSEPAGGPGGGLDDRASPSGADGAIETIRRPATQTGPLINETPLATEALWNATPLSTRHSLLASEALLRLAVVDPACGSGHFLLAAARRLAVHVARLQAAGTPSAGQYRHALRQVVGRCIYGVDLNPMAVELCRVSLWMETVEPGRPLSFLDSHIQRGNALLGTTPELMKNGVPDAAWEPIEGDDKKTASALKKRNKKAAEGQRGLDSLWSKPGEDESAKVAAAVAEVDAAPDADVQSLAAKGQRWQQLLLSNSYQHQRLVADAWCAAFVWPKQPGPLADAAPTNEIWRQLRDGQGAPALTLKTTSEVAAQYCFFHWHLAFPQIFSHGGFDVVLGNPPWDTLSPDTKEFFSRYDPAVRFQSKPEQEASVAIMLKDSGIAEAWALNRRLLFATAFFLKESGRYSLFAPGNLGKGDFNVYRLFVELALRLVREGGKAAQIVPDGFYAGANCMAIREELFARFRLDYILGFENARETWFPGVDSRAKFALYSALRGGTTQEFQAAFCIRSSEEMRAAVAGSSMKLSVAMIREFSPDALAVMEFRGQRDIDIARNMYQRWPPLGQQIPGSPHREFLRELESGHVQELLTEDRSGLPHYEGRMIAQYDHRAKGYRSGRARAAVWDDLSFGSAHKSIQPQWYVARDKVPLQTAKRVDLYRVGFCDVASPTNERTLVASVIPRGCIAGAKVPTVLMQSQTPTADLLVWLAVANSFAMDFLVRMKVSLTMALTILDSLPFPRLSLDDPRAKRLITDVLHLVCTGPEMNGLWNSMADSGLVRAVPASGPPPGCIDLDERQKAVARIEAEVAMLYGLTADDVAHILDTFPIVRKNDEKAHGEYRTKRVILEIYDAMAEVMRANGQLPVASGDKPLTTRYSPLASSSYQTRLDPPPADPRVAHPDTRGAKR